MPIQPEEDSHFHYNLRVNNSYIITKNSTGPARQLLLISAQVTQQAGHRFHCVNVKTSSTEGRKKKIKKEK